MVFSFIYLLLSKIILFVSPSDVHEEHKHLHVGKRMTQARKERTCDWMYMASHRGQKICQHKQIKKMSVFFNNSNYVIRRI